VVCVHDTLTHVGKTGGSAVADQRTYCGAAMLKNGEDLQQTMEQLGRMYRALAALRAEVLPLSRERFALMAEGPLDEIRQLQQQLDAHCGVVEVEEANADVWMRIEGPGNFVAVGSRKRAHFTRGLAAKGRAGHRCDLGGGTHPQPHSARPQLAPPH